MLEVKSGVMWRWRQLHCDRVICLSYNFTDLASEKFEKFRHPRASRKAAGSTRHEKWCGLRDPICLSSSKLSTETSLP